MTTWKHPIEVNYTGWNYTSGYGKRPSFTTIPGSKGSIDHKGIDIGFDPDNPPTIQAIKPGVIERVGWEKGKNPKAGYGYRVVVKHDDETFSVYAHLKGDSSQFKLGDTVNAGDEIGIGGNTGNSSGAHLHFSVLEGGYPSIGKDGTGKYIDPTEQLKKAHEQDHPDQPLPNFMNLDNLSNEDPNDDNENKDADSVEEDPESLPKNDGGGGSGAGGAVSWEGVLSHEAPPMISAALLGVVCGCPPL